MKKIWITLVGLFTKTKKKTTAGPSSQWPPMHTNDESPVREAVKAANLGGKKPSQQKIVVWALETQGVISVNDLRQIGVTRTARIISELRKKGWEIKTQYIFAEGVVKDIHYVLQANYNLPVA